MTHLQEVTEVLTFLDERIEKTDSTDINRDLYTLLRERYRMNPLQGYLKDVMEILGSPLSSCVIGKDVKLCNLIRANEAPEYENGFVYM